MAQARKWLPRSLALLTAALMSCSCGSGDSSPPPLPPPKSILFVGNSFSRVQGGIDAHVQALAASLPQPRTITVQRVTQDGATLALLRQDAALMQAIRAGGHDVVVLQDDLPEYSSQSVDPFKAEVRAFNQEIVAKSGRTVLFMAWAYERVTWISQAEIAAAHRSIGTELGIPVAPVGLAFDAARSSRPALAMLDSDREHESLHGIYLAACVIFATLYQQSPEGATYAPAGISADEASFLQRMAWQTVVGWSVVARR